MKNTRSRLISKLSPLPVLMLGGLLLALGCAETKGSVGSDSSAPPAKSGSELWAQWCGRCHNFRSPSQFSDSEWGAIMFHMRVRAKLTGADADAIREFLQASN